MAGFLPRPLAPDRVAATAPRSVRAIRQALAAAGPDAPAASETSHPLSLAVRLISARPEFEAVSVEAGDLVSNGRLVKFLVDRRIPGEPSVYFINGNFAVAGVVPREALYHYYFAVETLGLIEDVDEFNRVTYFQADKRYVAGTVRSYELGPSTSGPGGPLVGIQFYPQDVISEAAAVDAVLLVRQQIALEHPFAFVPTGSQQTVGRDLGRQLEAAGVSIVPLDRIVGAVQYLPLNLGEAWGVLRIFPVDLDELAPSDIPVFDELPLELSVVAGVLTKAVQDTNSHVNLKSKERRTPNAVLRDAAHDHPQLAPYADQPVHLVVARDRLIIQRSDPQTVAAKLAERLTGPTIQLRWEPDPDQVRQAHPRQRRVDHHDLVPNPDDRAGRSGETGRAAVLPGQTRLSPRGLRAAVRRRGQAHIARSRAQAAGQWPDPLQAGPRIRRDLDQPWFSSDRRR